MALLLVVALVLAGACGNGGNGGTTPTGAPPPPSYEAPPVAEMMAMGETATCGGMEFTVIEYVLTPEIRGEVPLQSGYQFLLVSFKAENTTGGPLAPPYLDGNILIVHKGEASGVPSLIFSPTVPLPDGRDVSHYSYRSHFQGALDGGAVTEGWEAYYVPIEFSAVDTYVRVTFESGEEFFWSLSK